jgi:hypothetical protein
MKSNSIGGLVAVALALGLASACLAGEIPAPPAPAAPIPLSTPLSTPSMTGPIQNPAPMVFDAGPFGKIAVNGVLTTWGTGSGNYVPENNATEAALGNGQVFIQKTDGWLQFYLQAGAYNIAALGMPFLATDKTISDLFGPVPVAFLKLQAGKNTSFEIGSLPTLVGAEYTFTFENMNINRGLLWNQENAGTRGIQVNQTAGKFTFAVSWNDYFYSDRYTAMSGSVTYANGPQSISFVGAGNLGQTGYQTYATPVQNNGDIYNVIYTYNKGSWIVQPYFQHTDVPANGKIGIVKGNATNGGAILLTHSFKHGFALPVRWEYIASSGSANDPEVVNLMYGPGSKGTSITVTPTVQYGGFFLRGDIAYVQLSDIAPGLAFGKGGALRSQPRATAEIGFIFGNNISQKKP